MYYKWLRVKYNFLELKLYIYKKIYKPRTTMGTNKEMIKYLGRVLKVFNTITAQENVLKQIDLELHRQRDLILMKVIGQ